MADLNIQIGSERIGVVGLLGVVFVILKLCHVIDWSWWWVTAPFWGGAALALTILAVMFALYVLANWSEY